MEDSSPLVLRMKEAEIVQGKLRNCGLLRMRVALVQMY